MRKYFRPYPLAIAAAGVCLFVRLFVFQVSGWVLVLAIAEPTAIVLFGYISYRYWEKAKLAQQELALEHAQLESLQVVNQELNLLNRTMQESSDIRADFVQSLTHALRGPIAIVRTAVDLLENEEHLSDRGQRYLGILKAQAQTAGKLIDDLLESFQLE